MASKWDVWISNSYYTGHPNVIWPALVRSVSQISRADRQVGEYYIGVASGLDHETALRRRIDDKKLDHKVSEMHLLYRSSTERYTRTLEDWLIAHFKASRPDGRIWNAAKGGGGRNGSGPNFFLYLAVTRY